MSWTTDERKMEGWEVSVQTLSSCKLFRQQASTDGWNFKNRHDETVTAGEQRARKSVRSATPKVTHLLTIGAWKRFIIWYVNNTFSRYRGMIVIVTRKLQHSFVCAAGFYYFFRTRSQAVQWHASDSVYMYGYMWNLFFNCLSLVERTSYFFAACDHGTSATI